MPKGKDGLRSWVQSMLLLQQRVEVAKGIEVADVVSTGVDGVGQRPDQDREGSGNVHLSIISILSILSIISIGATLACSYGYANGHENENVKGTRARGSACASRWSHC